MILPLTKLSQTWCWNSCSWLMSDGPGREYSRLDTYHLVLPYQVREPGITGLILILDAANCTLYTLSCCPLIFQPCKQPLEGTVSHFHAVSLNKCQ